jgi:myo-inositol-1-phosphate synthase
LLLVAGLGGAIGSTLAAAAALLPRRPELIRPYLTTFQNYPRLPAPENFHLAGWDQARRPLVEALAAHGVVPESLWAPAAEAIAEIPLLAAPDPGRSLAAQTEALAADMASLRRRFAGTPAVLVNLLPAAPLQDLSRYRDLDALAAEADGSALPDLAYVLAAIQARIPVVNFTPNAVEAPCVLAAAEAAGVPLAGRDGKTGQTYFKVALASALKARGLHVDGWYSANILGNADGANLDDPLRAAGKVANKTELLDEILGYRVGARYGRSTHMVRIDYYPPRGDAKEAWDVIDLLGLFELPMSLRIDLQGRDSILAAPLVLDLARWMTALQGAGRRGAVPELGFYFKKAVGPCPPLTFAEQLTALDRLAAVCLQETSP